MAPASPTRQWAEPAVHLRPTLNTDYYQTTDYAAAGDQLKALALGACTGSLTVVKQVVPSTTPVGKITGAAPAGGWVFAGAGSADVTVTAPTTRTTAAGTGAVNFPLTFAGGTTTGPVTLTETLQSGYMLQQVGGLNAVCTRIDTGASVPVTNNGGPWLHRDGRIHYPVSCTVYNRAPNPPASVVLNKTWVINGTTYAEGSQPAGFVATGTIAGTNQPWGVVADWLHLRAHGGRSSETLTLDPTAVHGDVPAADQLQRRHGGPAPFRRTGRWPLALNTYGDHQRPDLPDPADPGQVGPVRNCRADQLDTSTRWRRAVPCPARTGSPDRAGATGVPVTPGITYPLAESGGPLEYIAVRRPERGPDPWLHRQLDLPRGRQRTAPP